MEWRILRMCGDRVRRCLSQEIQLMVVVLLLVCCSPTCVLAQDINYTTTATTDMGEYTFFAGTTQGPQPSPELPTTPSPMPRNRMNRTSFNIVYEAYREQMGMGEDSIPDAECLFRQTAEKELLDFYLPNGGKLCPSYYDLIQCWPASEPGVHIRPCPEELNNVRYDTSDNVSRHCLFNGTWGNEGKSDYTRCEPIDDQGTNPHELPVKLITLSGYSLSFVALVGAFIIFLYFKSLRCVRNYIHWNLVSSFILLYISFFVALSTNQHVTSDPSSNKFWVCRLFVTVLNYCLMTNFFWMFVEGVYLYTLVARALTVRKDRFWVYCILGWGVPTIFVSIFAILNMFYDNECWLKEHSKVSYVITAPIIFLIFINLIFLIQIMCILVTKLRASHSLETQQYRKAVKGTFVLLPLLGVTYLIFIFKPQTDKNSVSFLVFQYLNAILHSTQGFFVAIIYVFMNQEVRNVIGRKITRWRTENTLPTRPVSRRGSNSRNSSLAQIFNNARRGSSNSVEEPTTLPFRLPGSGKAPPPKDLYANGTRVPPFVRLDEIQPLHSPIPTPPPCSPRTPPTDGGPPAYSELLFPVKEVDEPVEDSVESDQGDTEENHPLNEPVVEVIADPPPQHEHHNKCDDSEQEVEHNELTNGLVDYVEDKIPHDIVDQNENKKQPNGPIINCMSMQVPITVGGGNSNENNCNSNDGRRPPTSLTNAPIKRVTFEDVGDVPYPQRISPGGAIRAGDRGSNIISALYHSELTEPMVCHHDDTIDSSSLRRYPNRDDCCDMVSNCKQKKCILSDVRQMNAGVINGSIIFPKAPPGTPV